MQKLLLIILPVCLLYFNGLSQNKKLPNIEISFYKSTYLYMPSKIVNYDLGFNEEIEAETDGKKIKITAIKEDLNYETNLTIETKDGLYGFILVYKTKPVNLYHFIKKEVAIKAFSNFKEPNDKVKKNEEFVLNTDYEGENDKVCKQIYETTEKRISGGVKEGSVFLGVENIYIHNNRLYFKVIAENYSNIDYDIEFIKFRVEDKKQMTKSAIQEDYKTPLYIYKLGDTILSKKTTVQVFVFNKFTITGDKLLYIELQEKKGSRHVSFYVKKREILRAKKI